MSLVHEPGDKGYVCKSKIRTWLCPVPPIIANVLIVPQVLMRVSYAEGTLLFFTITVGLGEIISCYVLGLIFLHALIARKKEIFKD